MAKSRIFLLLSLSFIFGIFCRSFFKYDYRTAIYVLLIISIITIAVFYKNKKALAIAGVFIFFILGIWRMEENLGKLNSLSLDGKEFSGNVTVVKEPEQKENYQSIIAEFRRSSSKNRILINANKYLPVTYGDELNVNCDLNIPNNKNSEFDYRMYLAKDGVYYHCEKPQIERTGKNFGGKIYLAILKLKNGLEEKINRVIPQPEAALGNGIIMGGSGRMSKEIQDNFSRTGMTHIVAVSGYNVTIIAEYLMAAGIFLGLWRKRAFWFALFGISLFILMIGFPSSAVRAGVMGGLLLWAAKNGRLANSYNAIIFAAAVMLIINPLLLRWDIGFQLSFLAALGIITLAPFLEKRFAAKHKALGFSEIFFLTLSAQIFVLPIIFYNFHTLSLVSIAANLLILLFVPVTMLLVFLSAVSGFILYPLSLASAWLAYLPLKYIIWLVSALSGLSWSSREVKNFGWLGIVVWYTVLYGIIYLLRKHMLKKPFKLNELSDF